jgi:hypothetical protein
LELFIIERKNIMFFNWIVRLYGTRRFEIRSLFLVLGLFIAFLPGFMINPFMTHALAQTDDKPAQQVTASGVELDEAALKASVAARIRATRGDQDERFKQFGPDLVRIDRKIPIYIQEMTFFAVKLKILSPPPDSGEESTSLVVDKSGTLLIADIQELASGNSLVQNSLSQLVRMEDVPPDFGKEIFKGNGNYSMLVISDPFCPYCRKGWDYIKTHLEKFKTLRLSHFPLNRSAEVTCMVMADAHHRQFKLFEIVDFSYTRLNPSPNPEDILKQFMDAFPELKEKWGEDPASVLKQLEENYLIAVREERKTAQSLGINSTPAFFVNDEFIKGFNADKIGKAMP